MSEFNHLAIDQELHFPVRIVSNPPSSETVDGYLLGCSEPKLPISLAISLWRLLSGQFASHDASPHDQSSFSVFVDPESGSDLATS